MFQSKLFLGIASFFIVNIVFGQSIPVISNQSPIIVISESEITLELYFEAIPQGQVGLTRIHGNNIESIQATFISREINFFSIADGSYSGLLAVSMEQSVRSYELTITIQRANDQDQLIRVPIDVTLGSFIRQDINISDDFGFLTDPQVEHNELTQLAGIVDDSTLERFWDDSGFQWPLDVELTSPFGAFRVFNQTISSRHTGWDMQAQMGRPVFASASGRVAFTGELYLRGNYVLIDHGYGIYSGYAHLSIVHVTRGQSISADQVIGQVGNSGRSGGAHFHWEMAVNGEWIDSVAFASMWLPTTIEDMESP